MNKTAVTVTQNFLHDRILHTTTIVYDNSKGDIVQFYLPTVQICLPLITCKFGEMNRIDIVRGLKQVQSYLAIEKINKRNPKKRILFF